jgi:hypothetical protein
MRVLTDKRILSAPIVDTHTGDYHGALAGVLLRVC